MDMSGYAYSLAEDNRRVADRNAGVADANARVAREWMAYAEKLKAKLSLVEQERDAMAARLRILQAQVHGLDTLQGKLAAELGKVSPRHPMISLHRREQIAEAAAQAAR